MSVLLSRIADTVFRVSPQTPLLVSRCLATPSRSYLVASSSRTSSSVNSCSRKSPLCVDGASKLISRRFYGTYPGDTPLPQNAPPLNPKLTAIENFSETVAKNKTGKDGKFDGSHDPQSNVYYNMSPGGELPGCGQIWEGSAKLMAQLHGANAKVEVSDILHRALHLSEYFFTS